MASKYPNLGGKEQGQTATKEHSYYKAMIIVTAAECFKYKRLFFFKHKSSEVDHTAINCHQYKYEFEV